MGWDVAVFGELTLPGERIATWEGTLCDPNAFHDWTRDFEHDAGTSAKVRDVIARFSELDPALGFVEVAVDGQAGRIRVRGHLAEDTYWAENRVLASLFRSAAPLDGRGSITFVGFETIDFGYRFEVANGASMMVVLDETMRRAADASSEVAAIRRAIEPRLASLREATGGTSAAKGPDEAAAIAVVEKAASGDSSSDDALVAKQGEAIALLGASGSREATETLVAALTRGARPELVAHALIGSPSPEVAGRVTSALTPAFCKSSKLATCQALRVLSKRLEIGDPAPVIAIFEKPETFASKRFREKDTKELRAASARALVASGDAAARAAVVRALPKHGDAIIEAIGILDVRARDAVLALAGEPGVSPALRERIEERAGRLLRFDGAGVFGMRR